MRIAIATGKFSLAAAVMGVPSYYLFQWLHRRVSAGFVGAFAEFGIVSVTATLIYVVVVYLMKAEELSFVYAIVTRKLGKK